MTTFGAVPVSAFNMHRLLAGGEAVLLFPGMGGLGLGLGGLGGWAGGWEGWGQVGGWVWVGGWEGWGQVGGKGGGRWVGGWVGVGGWAS